MLSLDGAYLAYKLLVSCRVKVFSKGLLQKRQQDRDDDAGFDCFSETDEEYYL